MKKLDAQLRLFGDFDQLVDDLIVDVLLYQQARAGNARLAGCRKYSRNGPVGRFFDIAVIEYDVR